MRIGGPEREKENEQSPSECKCPFENPDLTRLNSHEIERSEVGLTIVPVVVVVLTELGG